MKNNISYYSHYSDSDQHAKFKMLRVRFGWSGEGKFWALNNRIAQAENCYLDISKKYNKAAIASDLDFSLPEFEEFITFLIEDCELIKEGKNNIITTDIVQEIHEKVMDERAKARERSERKWKKLGRSLTKFERTSDEKEEVSVEKNKVSTEKVSKVKESKVKEKKEEKRPPALVLQTGINRNKTYRAIIAYLNKKAGVNYKHKTKSTRRFIDSRLNEGAKEEDFFIVIDYKTAEWLGTEQQRYLRPETLFGTKFESYCQKTQKQIKQKPKIKHITDLESHKQDSSVFENKNQEVYKV